MSGRLCTTKILVLIGTAGASPHRGEILPPCDFLFWLSCPVLSCPGLSCPLLFSRERAQVEPLNRFSRFMAQTTCFHVRKCLLGSVWWVTSSGGNIPPKLPQKWAWIGNFKTKGQNIKITISPNLWIRSRPNLRTNFRPTIALRGWSNVGQSKKVTRW